MKRINPGNTESFTAANPAARNRSCSVGGMSAGKPLILPAAAEFVKQVVPAADLRYFDGGHFVLDEYAEPIAEAIVETFCRLARMRN